MPNIIEAINYYPCGYCTNDQATMFKKQPKKELVFPAGAFLIKHRTQGYILYDTGYSTDLYQKKWKYRLYNRLNPTYITRTQMIDQQLERAGIKAEEIQQVILSHLHPDHIGGAALFSNARFWLSEAAYQTFKTTRWQDLVFKELLPPDFEQRIDVIRPTEKHACFPYQETYDLFRDGRLLVSSFDGHAKGQLCLYVTELRLFIAADIAWGIDLLDLTPSIRLIPSLIQDDMPAYRQSIACLKQIMADGHKVIVSHDPEIRIREVLG